MTSATLKRISTRFFWSFLIVIIQILFALIWTPHTSVSDPSRTSLSDTYLRLMNWDSDHYADIAEKGYYVPCQIYSADHEVCLQRSPVTSDDIHQFRANVVFLPGYPLTVRGVSRVTGLSTRGSMLLVSQLMALIFWFYFFTLLDSLEISVRSQLASAFAVAVHPAAFFMIMGYTESLFLAAMLGYFYWCNQNEANKGARAALAWTVALFHGLLLCWTRIVGVAVTGFPVLRGAWRLRRGRIRLRSILLVLLSLTGLIAFFFFCQKHFGNWALYFELEETGWQNQRRYFALFNPLMYLPPFFFEDTIQSLNKFAVTFTGFLLIWVARAEWKVRSPSFLRWISSTRGSLFIIAFGMFYIALTGKANSNLDSMLRYTFPSYILLVIQVADINAILKRRGTSALFFAHPERTSTRLKLACSVIASLGFQAWCIYRFTHGHWVA